MNDNLVLMTQGMKLSWEFSVQSHQTESYAMSFKMGHLKCSLAD